MDKRVVAYAVGVLLILTAALVFVNMINHASSYSASFSLEPHENYNKTVSFVAGKTYIVSLHSTKNVNLSVVRSHHVLVHVTNNTVRLTLKINETGNYVVSVTNFQNSSASVSLSVISKNEMASMDREQYYSMIMCISGLVIVLLGIILNIRVHR